MAETEKPSASTDPGRGRRIGIDVGSVRIGVAMCDPDCILATPVETVPAAVDGSDVRRVVELVRENNVVEVIVGLPVALRGNHTASTYLAEESALDLREDLNGIEDDADETDVADEPGEAAVTAATPEGAAYIPVRLVDERMSTMAATQALQSSGVSAKKGRKKIDQAAAVHILQGWLDARRRVIDNI